MIERIHDNPQPVEKATAPTPSAPRPLGPLAPRPLSAFTLIELLVTISIIVLLVGLVVVGASQMRGSAKVDQTNVALSQLASALTEYKAKTGGTTPTGDIEDFIDFINNQGGSAQKMLASVPDAMLVRDDDADPDIDFVNDRWGNKVVYYDNDGRNNGNDLSGGLPPRPQPYFASAGPDGQWGAFTVNGNDELVRNKAAKDNIYSFNTGR